MKTVTRLGLVAMLLLLGACATETDAPTEPTESEGTQREALGSAPGVPENPERTISVIEDGSEYFGHLVSLGLARAVAESGISLDDTETKIPKRVVSHSVAYDGHRNPALYAFNYEGGGFVVVAADTEFSPIVAFADEGAIDLQRLPVGADDLVRATREAIEGVRVRRPDDDEDKRAFIDEARTRVSEWEPLFAELAFTPPPEASAICQTCENTPPPPPCTSHPTTTTGPLLKTKWGQGAGFNNQTPGISGQCAHALTGCSQTAAAQLIRYWKHSKRLKPNGASYNFSAMPNDYGNDEIATLMAAIGKTAGASWGCNLTSTPWEGTVNALASFGYDAHLYGISTNPAGWLPNYISANQPVLLGGTDPSGTHIWVADGVRTVRHLPNRCAPAGPTVYLHHNWGWDGYDPWGNGWYVSLPAFYKKNRFITAVPH